MSERLSEKDVIEAVGSLTRARLTSFMEAEIVRPVQTSGGPRFRRADLARLELMCELGDLYDLEADSLALVMSLIDRMHDLRRELRLVLEAVAEEGSDELRRRIGRALCRPL